MDDDSSAPAFTMSSVSATSRTVARTLAHRVEIDWSRPVWTCSPQVTSSYNKLRSWVAMSDSMLEKYGQPPPAIDFASHKKKVRDQELVNELETFYNASKPPPESHEWPADEQHVADAKLEYFKELDALHKEFLPVLQEEVNFQMNNRTNADTTMFDMKVNYPLIHEEIEDELERRQWFKDTGIGTSN